ncbi:MAG: hypothetical protein ACE5FL_12850 [Myxococcota bacterium]
MQTGNPVIAQVPVLKENVLALATVLLFAGPPARIAHRRRAPS